MKRTKLVILMVSYVVIMTSGCKEKTSAEQSIQPKRPKDYKPFRYKYTTQQLYENFSEDMMKRAAEDVRKLVEVNENGVYKPTPESLASHPMPDWFNDAKLGIFLDWGPWSVAGYATPRDTSLGTGGSYPDWYEFLMDYSYKEYHDTVWGTDFRRDDFLPLLTGENFNSEEYINLAVEAGAKYFVPFSRHHAGWAMWESQYTFRNAKEMGPMRDIYKELYESARSKGLKFALYFSIAEWEYPVIVDKRISQWDPVEHLAIFHDAMAILPRPIPYASYFPAIHDRMISGKIPVRNYFSDYMMPLFKEAVDKFDPDLIWYDGGWGTPVPVSRAAELSAYFYNQAEGRKEVVINNRAGSTFTAEDMVKISKLMEEGHQDMIMEMFLKSPQLGDYTTPEYTIGEVNPVLKWEVCRSISPAFGYNWTDNEENSLTSEGLIELFIGIVAGNGNLLLVISPDGSGKLPDIQKNRLIDLGAWLKVNGESIYATIPWTIQQEGDLRFTQSKDGKHVYIHCITWPGDTLTAKNIPAIPGSTITILGQNNPLQWKQDGADIMVSLPAELQEEKNRPCKYAWVFKVQVKE